MAVKLELKINKLQSQLEELQKAHKQLAEHYHEFVKATVQYLKEDTEEE